MAVSINTERKGVEVSWDSSLSSHKKVTLKFTRGDDVSESLEFPNDGLALVSYPSDFTGTSHVEVLDESGKMFDSGDITIK
jgi:hypothetical protein